MREAAEKEKVVPPGTRNESKGMISGDRHLEGFTPGKPSLAVS